MVVASIAAFAVAMGVATAAVALTSPGGAIVSGKITRAETNASWTQASIAGSAEWTNCPEWPEEPEFEPFGGGPEIIWDPGPRVCSWTPYATVAPESVACDSPARHLNQLGNDVYLSWQGVVRTAADIQTFDVPNAPIGGTEGQLLCLSMWETVPERDFCAFGETAAEPPGGPQPGGLEWECPEYLPASNYYTLDSAPLRSPAVSTPPDSGSSHPPPPAEPSGAAFRSVAVPWAITSILGPRSLRLSWTAKYCLGAAGPDPGRITVGWHQGGSRKFLARITAFAKYPIGEGRDVSNPGCEGVGEVSMSRRLKLPHSLRSAVLLDGSSSPAKRRWPG